jgi:hypothetical protein
MGTTFASVQALCPLCGSPVLSIARSGRGYTLCDDCGILTNLPSNLTRN